MNLDGKVRQADFGALVGVTQQAVSDMVNRGVLEDGAPLRVWLLAYCARLRAQAAGRLGAGGLDLAQERAALSRSQRAGFDIKNAALRGQYASTALLAEVLATVSHAVAAHFDQLTGLLDKACPNLPPAAVDQLRATVAAARGEWVRQTAALRVTTPPVTPESEAADDESPGIDGEVS